MTQNNIPEELSMAGSIVAFKMSLLPNQCREYKLRHDQIWPKLTDLLKESGISDYSIFYDDETSSLFGTYCQAENNTVNLLPESPIMQEWWEFMGDIMKTELDNQPISKPLRLVFHLD